MEIDHNNIEKYIQGELNGNELIEFEALLKKDETLRKKIAFYQYSMSVLSENQISTKAEEEKLTEINPILEGLRNKYFINKAAKTEIPEEEPKSKPGLIKRLFPYVALTAAAAILIFFFLPTLQKRTNLEIAENNFKIYPLGTQMGELEETIKNYNNGNFEEADTQLTARLNELPNSPDLWLAKGCTTFVLDNINVAISSFKKVFEVDDSEISHPYANWYLALCYLKKDELENAIHHLKEIKEGADNYTEAKRLLKQLK